MAYDKLKQNLPYPSEQFSVKQTNRLLYGGYQVISHKQTNPDPITDASESVSSGSYWIEWFLEKKGNEFFCEVEIDYITDRFNIAGLNLEVGHFSKALNLISDSICEDYETDLRKEIEMSAEHLYGLIHARYILTQNGMERMFEKYKQKSFGLCPRVLCEKIPVIPMGLSDIPGERSVKLFCPRCQDAYISPFKLHHSVDGAYFGTCFPHTFLLAHPEKTTPPVRQIYIPKIFGFKIHSHTNEAKNKLAIRDALYERLNLNSTS